MNQRWAECVIDHVMTSSVRIEVMSVYTDGQNGLVEVEFYVGISKSAKSSLSTPI